MRNSELLRLVKKGVLSEDRPILCLWRIAGRLDPIDLARRNATARKRGQYANGMIWVGILMGLMIAVLE